jgi:hypothetical protein
MAVLQQSDLVAALTAPGILYLEGYTDLNLLREWADLLKHPLMEYLNRTPFWQPVVWKPGDESRGIKADEHYKAIQIVKSNITGVWLVDADGKTKVRTSSAPESRKTQSIGVETLRDGELPCTTHGPGAVLGSADGWRWT